MEIVSAIISSILGFVGGLLSSYIFWFKQRKLDRPRIVLEIDEQAAELRFVAKNKGGSFAERVNYTLLSFGAEAVNSHPVYFDDVFAPNEVRRMHLNLPQGDTVVEFEYLDVFGKGYEEAWDIHYDEDMGEPYYVVFRRDDSTYE